MTQLSDDCFAHGGTLMPVAEALALLGERLQPITDSETVPLQAALGRILAENVIARADVPPQDNSAVDGYAVRFEDLAEKGETRLPVVGRIAAGHPMRGSLKKGTAVRIFTGAPMPEGPDTVFMDEDCRREGEVVVLPPGIKPGANRRRRGEDVTAGTIVVPRGQRLRAQDIGQAASSGRISLSVSRPLRVALFSTGDELREPGSELPPGCIYDSNRYTVGALLRGLGCEVNDLGILEDRFETIRDALAGAAAEHDLVMTSGGVSVGDEDHVKPAVEAQGHLHFWRLAIKPGRPIALGQIGATPFVGLPGNPVAVVVTFVNIVRPMIQRLMGALDVPPHAFSVPAAFAHRKKKDRREWLRARLSTDAGGRLVAVKFPRDGAGILSSLVEADGLVELPEALTTLEAGSMVSFLPFSELCS